MLGQFFKLNDKIAKQKHTAKHVQSHADETQKRHNHTQENTQTQEQAYSQESLPQAFTD